jgi:hypothetical protein
VDINDMFISIHSECKPLLYADNSPPMFSHKHVKTLEKNWNRVVNGLSTTSCVHTLINLSAFFLCQSEKLKTMADFQINCNSHLIKSQSSNKYLGIDIDHNLSGERKPLV